MHENDMDIQYQRFIQLHRDSIAFDLQQKYDKLHSKFQVDFGGNVCIPLLVIYAITLFLMPHPVNRITLWIVSIIYLILAIWLKRYVSTILTTVCTSCFEEYEYTQLVLAYLKRCKTATLDGVESEKEMSKIEQSFLYYEKRIINEHFSYR